MSFFLDSHERSLRMSYRLDDRLPAMRTPATNVKADTDGSELVHTMTADDYIYRARLAEKALRYEDMLVQMRHVLDLRKKLSADERNLLVVAYKNAVTTRRTGCFFLHRYKASPNDRRSLLLAIRHLSVYGKKLDEAKFAQVEHVVRRASVDGKVLILRSVSSTAKRSPLNYGISAKSY